MLKLLLKSLDANSFDLKLGDAPQKSLTRPFLSQSPYLVGSGPVGPPISPLAGFVPSGKRANGSSSSSCGATLSVEASASSVFLFSDFFGTLSNIPRGEFGSFSSGKLRFALTTVAKSGNLSVEKLRQAGCTTLN